jgi:predicted CoA-binding protein
MEIKDFFKKNFPPLLLEINDPPEKMRIIGELPKTEKYLAVVGSRKYSEYGKAVCEKLIEGLAGYSITIVSGLALGMDSIGHRAALKAGLHTIAIPGSGLSEKVLYPSSHRNLAKEIVESGGCLISEFEDENKSLNSAIYGAGFYGAFLAANIKMIGSVKFIIDQNPYLHGKYFFGRKVISPNEIPDTINTVYVGLNPTYSKTIIQDIQSLSTRHLKYFYL